MTNPYTPEQVTALQAATVQSVPRRGDRMTELSEGVGYLTWEQFSRFRWAVHYSLKLVPWLRVAGYIRTGDPDEVRGKLNEMPLGVPPTWLAAEEITRLSQELNGWPDLEDVAADDYGADIALQFTREVQTAAHRWPFEDRPHRVEYVRCPACGLTTLRYCPPEYDGDEVTVSCRECGNSVSGDEFAALAALIAAEYAEVKEKRERRLGDRRAGDEAHQTIAGDDLPVGVPREGQDDATWAGAVA